MVYFTQRERQVLGERTRKLLSEKSSPLTARMALVKVLQEEGLSLTVRNSREFNALFGEISSEFLLPDKLAQWQAREVEESSRERRAENGYQPD